MDKTILIDGNKIFYRVSGNGRPIMLVHGFGETGEVWKSQADYLQHAYRLIVPDLPGSGRSDLVPDMSMEGMADVLKSILENEETDTGITGKVTMIGHSMGGYITLAFVEKFGHRLHSFGLFHSTAFVDTEEKKATRRKGIAFIREHGAFEFLKTATPNLFSPGFRQENGKKVEDFLHSQDNFSPQALVLYYESMIKRPDRAFVLKDTNMPVLFIMGEFDQAIPLQDGLRQCHLPKRAYINILHHSGHMGMIEETAGANRMLEAFLSER